MGKAPPPPPKKYRLKRFVRIEADMFASVAYRILSGKAAWVLGRFIQKQTWTKDHRGTVRHDKNPDQFSIRGGRGIRYQQGPFPSDTLPTGRAWLP